MTVDVSGTTIRRASGARETQGREAALAERWAAGAWRLQMLRAESGERYRLLFQGRPGGGAGPDFRDAVLLRDDGTRVRGDVELHLHARNWRAHGHSADPRYNGVVLHAVLATSASQSPLANGALVPIVVLHPPRMLASLPAGLPAGWPCEGLVARSGSVGVRELLLAAGHARFDAKAAAFAHELTVDEPGGDETTLIGWTRADNVLFVALAEALGYGRDRAALRAAGIRLTQGEPREALLAGGPDEEADGVDGGYRRWPRVERLRLRGMLALYGRWRARGPWRDLREALRAGNPRQAGRELARAPARGRWQYLARPRAHHGGECRAALRGCRGDGESGFRAGLAGDRGLRRAARAAVESDYPRDAPPAWAIASAVRSRRAAGTAPRLGELVPRQTLRGVPQRNSYEFLRKYGGVGFRRRNWGPA